MEETRVRSSVRQREKPRSGGMVPGFATNYPVQGSSSRPTDSGPRLHKTTKARAKTGNVHEQRGNLRELATLIDLPFQVSLLVQQILQSQMGLVHLRTCVSGSLLMRARLGVCGAIVGLELAEKGHCARLDDLWVVAHRRRRVRQPMQVLDYGVRVVAVVIQHGGGVF